MKVKAQKRLTAKLDAREKDAARGWIVCLVSAVGRESWISRASPPQRTVRRERAYVFLTREAAEDACNGDWMGTDARGAPSILTAQIVEVLRLVPGFPDAYVYDVSSSFPEAMRSNSPPFPKAGTGESIAPLAIVLPPEDPVLLAMRMELRGQLDKPLTGRSLFLLEQTAALARQLFALRTAPDGLAKLRGKTNGSGSTGLTMSSGGPIYMPNPLAQPQFPTSVDYLNGEGLSEDGLGVAQGIPMSGALATAPGIETFGASAIRELLGNVTKKKEEPLSDLIADVTQAERHGERDIAAALREKIRVRLGASEPFGPPEKRVAKMAKRRKAARRLRVQP